MILFDCNNTATVIFHSLLGTYHKDGEINKDNLIEDFNLIKKEFTSQFIYFTFDSILKHRDKRDEFGKFVAIFDSEKYSWRKRLYPLYKYDRIKKKNKSQNDKFISKLNNMYLQLFKDLLEMTNIMTFQLEYDSRYGIEADDIIATLATKVNEKHLIISNDSDFFELLNENIRQFNHKENHFLPIPSKKAVEHKRMEWYVLGQAKDNIKNIKYFSELSPDFIKWVNENYDLDINETHLDKIEKHKDITDRYFKEMYEEDEKEIEEGKRKRQRNRTFYKVPTFGEAKLDDFLKDLDNNLNVNKRWKHHFKRNQKLINLSRLPSYITNKVIRDYEKKRNEKKIFDKIKFSNILRKYNADKVIERLSEF